MFSLLAHNGVLLFGALIVLICAIGLVMPLALIELATRFWRLPAGLYLAVGIRLIAGGLLVYTSSISKYPTIFFVLGVLTIMAAIGIPLIGKRRVSKLIEWFAALPTAALRGWLVCGIIFGGFLIYGLW